MPLRALVRAQRTAAGRPGTARPHRVGRSVATSRTGLWPPQAAGSWRSGRAADERADADDSRGISRRAQRTRVDRCRSPILTPPTRESRISFPPPHACSVRWQTSSGVRSTDPDTRPWLRHAAWPPDYRPLIDPPLSGARPLRPVIDAYAFVRVEGDGVHEIAVGPVHAGIIEPGPLSLLGGRREGVETRRALGVRA